MRGYLGIVFAVGLLACGGGPRGTPSSAPPTTTAAADPASMTAAIAANRRLVARGDCPAAGDPELRALAAPRDDASAVVAPTLDGFAPLVELLESCKQAIDAMRTRGCATGLVAVGLASARWNRAAVMIGRRLLDTVWKTDPLRDNREHGLQEMESGFAETMIGLFSLSYELAVDPATLDAVWQFAGARATYAPFGSEALHAMSAALSQQAIPRAQGTPSATHLRAVAATISAVERGKPAPLVAPQQLVTGALQADGWYRVASPHHTFSVALPGPGSTLVLDKPGETTGEIITAIAGVQRLVAVCLDRPAGQPLAELQRQKFADAVEVAPAPQGGFDGLRFHTPGQGYARLIAATPRFCMMIVELTDPGGAIDPALVDRFFASLQLAAP